MNLSCYRNVAVIAAFACLAGQPRAARSHAPGTLANPGFQGQPLKGVYFFAGEWRFPGLTFYDGPVPGVRLTPASNHCLYTIFPGDGPNHLGWSESRAKREHAVDLMLAAGINVVNMSYWGPPNTDRWAFWAPMHTAPGAHDELFDTVVGKPVLVMPSIESSSATVGRQQRGCSDDLGPVGQSPPFDFLEAFPGSADNPAPDLVEQIIDLVDRYILHPANPEWREKWAQMYDRDGRARFVVSLIHVGSNQPGVTDDTFARGFSRVADRVYAATGIHVGFALDVLPAEHNARFKPTPSQTGPLLAEHPAVLAIQPFNPEVFTGRCAAGENCDAVLGSPQLVELIDWKQRFVSSWVSTGIPVILDVSPGYDARRVFPGAPRYGNNETWRRGQAGLLSAGVRGLTANTWNGYTEGYALVPSCSAAGPPGLPGCGTDLTGADAAFHWFRGLTTGDGRPARLPARLVGTNPPSGVYSDALNLTFSLTSFDLANALFETPDRLPVGNRSVRIRLGNQEVEGTTADDGVVRVSVTIDQQPGDVQLRASFDGDAEYLSITVRGPVHVARETTRVQWLSTAEPGRGPVTLAARLTDDDDQPVGRRPIVFTVDPGPDARTCSGVTDADGVARCGVTVARSPGHRTVIMDFAGDVYYEPVAVHQRVDLNPSRR